MNPRWKTYEEVAAYLLNQFAKEFGLIKVEGKQVIEGYRSGTKWEIDAKGIKTGNEGFVIVECRRYTTSKQNQEKLGSLAYRIIDTGAEGGIVVSPLGIQEGAQKIAKAENIVNVTIDANSTPSEFGIQFLNKIMIGLCDCVTATESIIIERRMKCQSCGEQFTIKEDEKFCPDCTKKQKRRNSMTKEQSIMRFLHKNVFDPILNSPSASNELKQGVRYTIMRMEQRDAVGMIQYYWSAIVGTEQSTKFARQMKAEGFIRFEEIIDEFRETFSNEWIRLK